MSISKKIGIEKSICIGIGKHLVSKKVSDSVLKKKVSDSVSFRFWVSSHTAIFHHYSLLSLFFTIIIVQSAPAS